ncbi:MAG: mechanosensitive ion channel protein MscS, partial [Pseudomonadota bacterium]
MKRLAAALIALALTAVLVAPGAAQEEAPKTEAQRLIELLENDEARAALIDSLKQAEAATGEGDAPAPPPPASLGREIAEFTKGAAERAADAFGAVRTQIERAPEAFRSLSPGQIAILIDALQALALVIVATMAVYLALRVAARRLYRRLGAATHDAGVLRTAAMLVATTLIDVMVVVAAWGAGYLAALVFYGDVGVIGVRQSLYLNAFLIVGMVRVLIGAVLSPATGELRFVAVSDAAARRMARWFGLIASILGYGQLLIVPIVNRQASLAAGRGVSTLLALVAILLAAALVWRWRREVAAWLLGEDPEG